MLRKKYIRFQSNIFIMKNFESLLFIGNLGFSKNFFLGCDVFLQAKTNKVFCFSKCSFSTFFSILKRNIVGVTRGYFLRLNFIGIGYKFITLGQRILCEVGYNHYVCYIQKQDTRIIGLKKKMIVFGLNLEEVNRLAYFIWLNKKPNIYTGKGIRYEEEIINLKIGKQR